MYRNATDFWIFILYPATLPNSLIHPYSFLVVSVGFSEYGILTPANSDNFNSSFPIWISFIFLSCLTGIARTSNTLLNKSGENGHSCLFSGLREMLSAFCHWVWCQLWACQTGPLLCWGIFPLYLLCWEVFFFKFLIYLLFIFGCVGSSFLCEGFL